MQSILLLGITFCSALCWADAITNTGAPPTAAQAVNYQPISTNPAPQVLSLKLKPTAIASPGVGGVAELGSDTVTLHLSHLGPGRYELKALRREDQVYESLGTITIADPTLAPDRQASDNKKQASAQSESVALETDVKIALPGKLSLPAIQSVLLLDRNGNTILVGHAK